MCHTSPAKQLRSVKRTAKFLIKKNTIATPKKPLLTAVLLPQTDIQPDSPKMLEVKRNARISIFPKPKNISFRKFLPFEIVPGAQDTDRLFFSSYIDGCTFATTFVCHICYDDYSYRSAKEMRAHLHQDHHHQLGQALGNKRVVFPEMYDLN